MNNMIVIITIILLSHENTMILDIFIKIIPLIIEHKQMAYNIMMFLKHHNLLCHQHFLHHLQELVLMLELQILITYQQK